MVRTVAGAAGRNRVHIEAAAYHGSPYISSRSRHGLRRPIRGLIRTQGQRVSIAFALVIVGGLLVFGSILAWRNVKSRRGDQHGAWRLAAFVFSLTMITWVVGASHVAGLWEAYNLTLVLAWALSRRYSSG